MNIETIIREKQGTIVDVRTRAEFSGGHVSDSVNIPLDEIVRRMEEIKSFKAPLILCCASGGRSSQATQYLASLGMECYNGGSWLSVNYYQSQTI
jgi:phage shock protein E